MRKAIVALLLASVECQSVCKLEWFEQYADPDCKQQIKMDEKKVYDLIERSNQMLQMSPDECQKFDPKSQAPQKSKVMCLDGEHIKILNYNGLGEDPECQHPYPESSKYPSFIAQSGQCVRVAPDYYVRYKIGPTVPDPFTKNSWDLPYDEFSGKPTMEQMGDESAMAIECMVDDLKELYHDSECKDTMKMGDEKSMQIMMAAQNMIARGNQITQSPGCEHLDPSGKSDQASVKARFYCLDSNTLSLNYYNFFEEDNNCQRKYPEWAFGFQAKTIKEYGCVQMMEGVYANFAVRPYDGRKWEYNPDAVMGGDHHNMDDQAADMTDFDGPAGEGGQGFSFEGDGYSVDVQMDNSNGYKQTTTMKFDNYFMYGVDYMGQDQDVDMPSCGPEADHCKEATQSDEYCCAKVQSDMLIDGQQAIYRCMNMMVVDASFSFEIDGMKMSMSCMKESESAASYISGAALLASGAALIASSLF